MPKPSSAEARKRRRPSRSRRQSGAKAGVGRLAGWLAGWLDWTVLEGLPKKAIYNYTRAATRRRLARPPARLLVTPLFPPSSSPLLSPSSVLAVQD